jgi:hypothetical protein
VELAGNAKVVTLDESLIEYIKMIATTRATAIVFFSLSKPPSWHFCVLKERGQYEIPFDCLKATLTCTL